jgi:hypothetical protein
MDCHQASEMLLALVLELVVNEAARSCRGNSGVQVPRRGALPFCTTTSCHQRDVAQDQHQPTRHAQTQK